VIITQESVLDTVVEAPPNATLEQLTELALQEADYGDDAFECDWSETTVGPPEGNCAFRYARDATAWRDSPVRRFA
jgi:hypothetical protein